MTPCSQVLQFQSPAAICDAKYLVKYVAIFLDSLLRVP
jgi:hypothetical protein